jgi:hypothetical protein
MLTLVSDREHEVQVCVSSISKSHEFCKSRRAIEIARQNLQVVIAQQIRVAVHLVTMLAI